MRILALAGTALATAALAAVPLTGTATAAAAVPATAPTPQCDPGKLCVWDGPDFGGTRHDFFYCGDPFPVGGVTPPLADVRSYVNNQAPGTVSTFYGTDPNGYHRTATSTAYEVQHDLHLDGGVQFVKVC